MCNTLRVVRYVLIYSGGVIEFVIGLKSCDIIVPIITRCACWDLEPRTSPYLSNINLPYVKSNIPDEK